MQLHKDARLTTKILKGSQRFSFVWELKKCKILQQNNNACAFFLSIRAKI